MKGINKYLELKNEKNFIKELLGAALSRFGDGIDTIAFAILIYHVTGSTLMVATLFAVNGLPNLIFGIISGAVSTHKNEKTIMTVCDFGRGICIAIMVCMYATNILESWHLYVITFLNSSFEAFRAPASTGIFPRIISENLIDDAIALKTSITKITEVAGIAIAATIVAVLGVEGALLIDAATFILCGLIVFSIKIEKKPKSKITIVDGIKEIAEGFSYVKTHNAVKNICIFTCIINIVFIPINVFQVPYVEEVLHGTEAMLSVMGVSASVAMALSALIIPSMKNKFGEKIVFLTGGILMGISYFLMTAIKTMDIKVQYTGITVGMALLGVGITIANFVIQTQFFEEVEQDYLSRVSAISSMFALCIVPIFSSISGVILNYISIPALFIGCGVLCILVFSINYIIALPSQAQEKRV